VTEIEAELLRIAVLKQLRGETEPVAQSPAQAREEEARIVYALRPSTQGIDAETRAALVAGIQRALKEVR
jgi:hypothetical protein